MRTPRGGTPLRDRRSSITFVDDNSRQSSDAFDDQRFGGARAQLRNACHSPRAAATLHCRNVDRVMTPRMEAVQPATWRCSGCSLVLHVLHHVDAAHRANVRFDAAHRANICCPTRRGACV